jgi:hypothetical protein
MTSIERAYWRVFKTLAQIQQARREQERESAFEQVWVESVKQSEQAAEPPVGFVSQNVENEPVIARAAGQNGGPGLPAAAGF